MKLNELLLHRDELLRQARLANVAYVYQRLGALADRVARAGLRGEVTLRSLDPETNRPAPALIGGEISQSVIEEHFLDQDIAELVDLMAFVHDALLFRELKFRLEDIGAEFLPKLRLELEAGDIVLAEDPAPPVEDSNLDAA